MNATTLAEVRAMRRECVGAARCAGLPTAARQVQSGPLDSVLMLGTAAEIDEAAEGDLPACGIDAYVAERNRRYGRMGLAVCACGEVCDGPWCPRCGRATGTRGYRGKEKL